jgi:glyoxylase-like metal-dependent hydrolase (beta-lactamase superfamily II)
MVELYFMSRNQSTLLVAAVVESAVLEQVTDDIVRIALGRTNAYLVLDRADGSAVLVDTGLPVHGPRVLAALAELGVAPERLRAILLTHRHLDHCGSAAALRRRSGAPVVIHEADAPGVRGAERSSPLRGALDWTLGPLVALLDRRILRFEPCDVVPARHGWSDLGFTLLHLPGHTPGSSGFVHGRSGVVFCGDAAVNPGGRLGQPSRPFTLDPRSARRSQLVLAELDAPVYCFGHGTPLLAGGAALRRLAAE